jgi:phospholipid-binding lipoprotein MlaA
MQACDACLDFRIHTVLKAMPSFRSGLLSSPRDAIIAPNSDPFAPAAGGAETYRGRYRSMFQSLRRPVCGLALLAALCLGGCASTDEYRNPRDPWEPMNRKIYRFNKTLDKAVLKPVAKGYERIMPELLSRGVTNFFENIDDMYTLLNDLLQLKLPEAANDGARVAWNSTAGLAGLVDVASGMDLDKREEDLGLTMAHYGVGSGPYLVLPFLGPSTVRDGIGDVGRFVGLGPERWLFPDDTLRWTLTGVKFIDKRANLLQAEKVLVTAALDEYLFLRDAYLQRRHNLETGGEPSVDDLDDEFNEEYFEEDDLEEEEDTGEQEDESGDGDEAAAVDSNEGRLDRPEAHDQDGGAGKDLGAQ